MRKHYAAVKARLEAAPVLTGRVHDAALVDSSGVLVRSSYVILSGGAPETLGDERVTAPQSKDSDAEYIYRVKAVGSTLDAALAVADAVTAQLIGFAPTIPGRRCQKMKMDDSGDVEPDASVRPPMFYLDMDFALISRRG